ncbi:MAG: MBL fold metallo-hydrolase [Acidimicrobiales bacterium]
MAITIDQLWLGRVQLPEWHPRIDEVTADVYGFIIRHPDGVILVDTGVGFDNSFINELYQPDLVRLDTALAGARVDEREVGAIVNTHLHFDHCGQNHALPTTPVWVTEAEQDAATAFAYTVPEWAHLDPDRVRHPRDGEEIAEGVRLLSTPGHTAGHQSVSVTDGDDTVDVIVGQCCYCAAEFEAGPPPIADLYDPDQLAVAQHSLDRLRALHPRRVYFSHEAADPFT